MIKWDREEVAQFLGIMWKYTTALSSDLIASFPVQSGRGELRVSPYKEEIELTLFGGRSSDEQLASWLMVCERIDVHADVNETPCITFWPPAAGMKVFSWLGIYREKSGFSLFTGAARGFPATAALSPSASEMVGL